MRISSCGTGALDGAAAFEEAASSAHGSASTSSEHRSRRLGDLAGVDLIIGFEHHHIEHAVVDAGARRERAFTLPQLVELLEAHPAGGSPEERLATVRPGNLLEAPEILDPYGEPRELQEAIADEVEDLWDGGCGVALFR